MKRILVLIAVVFSSVACNVKDWDDEISDIKSELENQRLLIEALSQNTYIDDVNQSENSFTIRFSDGKSVTLNNGKTPLINIGVNGNWFIDGNDSGIKATGEKGQTPEIVIGDNGNWFIDGTDSGFAARGPVGDAAPKIIAVVQDGGGLTFQFSDGTSVYCALKNEKYSPRPEKGYENFSVFVNYYQENNTGNSGSVQDGNKPYSDYGVIALPENYTTDPASPTRLVILCQGTGERTGATTNPLSNHGWEYLLAKGYAVMDMNGMSEQWGANQGFPIKNQHYGNKYLIQSYRKGYDYVIKKYNLYKEVFMMGISMGGGASMLVTQSGVIPVIAQANFCPAISVYKQNYMNPWGGANQQKTIAGQWGFDNWNATTPSQEYFLQNIDKIKGYDNLLTNTFGDTKEQANANYGNDAERDAYYALSKYFPVPLKIWHCADDNTVLYRYSDFFVRMIQNADGKAWLRTMASGGHVGGWNNGKGSVKDKDINGKAITTSVPFYEAVTFIQRYE